MSPGKKICIDNGGTLTDICVFDGAEVHRTKTLTTPHDLSECFFAGLRKVSGVIFGEENVERLLRETASIRYSTTQGTNSLVERKGPRIGLVLSHGFDLQALQVSDEQRDLFEAIVGPRVAFIDSVALRSSDADAAGIVALSNELMAQGATRLAVCLAGAQPQRDELAFAAAYESAFPQHLLGTVALTLSHELAGDAHEARRIWTTLFNAFLHAPMENFLFNAQKRLKHYRSASPLLIFRNDGGAARVAKTAAIKTYSSGPRGGLEAMRAVAAQRGYRRAVSLDVGGTTSDIGVVEAGQIQTDTRGKVEGVPISLPLCDIASFGVGGGSIIRADEKGVIKVGPQSVGAAPGPACFGLGGQRATITDAALVLGLLDPMSYFGGDLTLDIARATQAVELEVARPLGLPTEQAALRMQQSWVAAIAHDLDRHVQVSDDALLFAFGGAGPLLICDVATAAGYRAVLIPKMAAVFSAYGVGYSDVSQQYEQALDTATDTIASALDKLTRRARRDMFAEGHELDVCSLKLAIVGDEGAALSLDAEQPASWPAADAWPHAASLHLRVIAPSDRRSDAEHVAAESSVATPTGKRSVVLADGRSDLPVYKLPSLADGASADGPAILEDDFFTGLVSTGWRFTIVAGGDALLERISSSQESHS